VDLVIAGSNPVRHPHIQKMKINTPVLGLNAHWMVCDVYPAYKAMGMIYSGDSIAINLDDESMIPTKWEDWVKLPIGEEDDSVKTIHGDIRLPRVIISVNYKKFHLRKLTLNGRNVAKMFGYKCGYTGKHIPIEKGSVDHYIPKSRGGKNSWSNVVYTSKELNNKKGNKTAEELGLKLISPLKVPTVLPEEKVLMDYGMKYPEWENFLIKTKK
jgi:5-methylcytosine-specific restriction endonuclease McrA